MEVFKYCTLDNPVFVNSIPWIVMFVVCAFITIHYKIQEAEEAQAASTEKKSEPV